MDEKQIRKFREAVHLLESVESQLTNLRKHGPKAAEDAATRHKALLPEVAAGLPHWKDAATAVVKLTEPVPAAEKAVEAVIRLNDGKKLTALKIEDVKKKMQGSMLSLRAVSDEGVVFWSAMCKIKKEFGGIDGAADDLKALYVGYGHYLEYLNHFRASLGRLA